MRGHLRDGSGVQAQPTDRTVLRSHRRIRGLPPLARGDQRLDREIIIGPRAAARLGVRADQRTGLVRRRPRATRTRVAFHHVGASPNATHAERVDLALDGPDLRDLLAVPKALRRDARVAVQRRARATEQPCPEAVDVEPVRCVANVMLGQVLPTLLRHLYWPPL